MYCEKRGFEGKVKLIIKINIEGLRHLGRD